MRWALVSQLNNKLDRALVLGVPFTSSRWGIFCDVISRRRIASIVTAILASLMLVLAPVAAAADGVGLAGRVDDKFSTYFFFGVIAFFAILVTVLSLIYDRLEAKKERRRSDLERFEG